MRRSSHTHSSLWHSLRDHDHELTRSLFTKYIRVPLLFEHRLFSLDKLCVLLISSCLKKKKYPKLYSHGLWERTYSCYCRHSWYVTINQLRNSADLSSRMKPDQVPLFNESKKGREKEKKLYLYRNIIINKSTFVRQLTKETY